METFSSYQKEKTNLFFTWLDRGQSLDMHQMGASKWLEGGKSKNFCLFYKQGVFFTPDIVEHDINATVKPWFDLILGSNTMKELGIISDFWTKEITLE